MDPEWEEGSGVFLGMNEFLLPQEFTAGFGQISDLSHKGIAGS